MNIHVRFEIRSSINHDYIRNHLQYCLGTTCQYASPLQADDDHHRMIVRIAFLLNVAPYLTDQMTVIMAIK